MRSPEGATDCYNLSHKSPESGLCQDTSLRAAENSHGVSSRADGPRFEGLPALHAVCSG
jgi:hypothetical protein